MSHQEATRPHGRVRRLVLRVVAVGCVLAVVILIAAHFAWKYSGSSKWELEREKNGIKIYALKTPGCTLKDFKAVRRIKLTLQSALAAMSSTETEECAAWAPGCVSVQSIQPWSSQDLSYIHLYRLKYPSPFSPREILIKAQASQEPASKAVMIEFMARPDALPRNECCFRVTELHNVWRFTPVGNGEVEVELAVHGDQGVPYPLVNRVTPIVIYRLFARLPKLLIKEKWQHTTFAQIREE